MRKSSRPRVPGAPPGKRRREQSLRALGDALAAAVERLFDAGGVIVPDVHADAIIDAVRAWRAAR